MTTAERAPVVCPADGTEHPTGARFCMPCGQPLPASPSIARDEVAEPPVTTLAPPAPLWEYKQQDLVLGVSYRFFSLGDRWNARWRSGFGESRTAEEARLRTDAARDAA